MAGAGSVTIRGLTSYAYFVKTTLTYGRYFSNGITTVLSHSTLTDTPYTTLIVAFLMKILGLYLATESSVGKCSRNDRVNGSLDYWRNNLCDI